MTNNPSAILMVGIILFCSLSGCIEDSSDELESDILELEDQNEQLNNTITTLRMENENLLNQIVSLNNSNNNSALQIQLLQLENHILEQNLRLQSLEHNSSLALLNDEIENLQNLLDEANQIIFEYLNAEAGLMGDPANPLLFEQYDTNGTYINHANWIVVEM